MVDATAFYAGIPFTSENNFLTTSIVYDEIKHIKIKQDALEILQQTNRLQIREPSEDSIKKVIEIADKTGDRTTISKQDISIIALALEYETELITDDFAVTNVAEQLQIKTCPLMTDGIKIIGKWISYCSACGKQFSKEKECSICGNKLRRKLIKK